MLREEESLFSKDKAPDSVANLKRSALNTYEQH